jgi:hypothetical protein
MVRNYAPIVLQLSLDLWVNDRGSVLEYGRSQFEDCTYKGCIKRILKRYQLPTEIWRREWPDHICILPPPSGPGENGVSS